MSVTGLCQICEAAEAKHDCNRCGKLVCNDHWDRESSLCVECVAETGGGRERTPAGPGSEDVVPPETDEDSTHQL